MFKTRCHVKINDNADIILGSHEHTVCGNKVADITPHIDGSIHDALVPFTEITSADEIISAASVKYFALATNVEINRSLDILPDGSAICLNGYKLSVVKGVQLFNITDKKIYITDCGLGGNASALTHSANQNTSVAPMFNVSGTAELYFYNVKVDGLTTNATNNQKFINAVGGKVVMSSTSITNVKNEATDDFITINNAKLVLDNVEFEHNANSKKFMTFNTNVSNVIVSSISIANNNNSGYMLTLDGANELKLGKIKVENNNSTGDGSVFYINGGTLTFGSDDTIIKYNKGVKGSVIRMASGSIKAETNVNMSYNESTDGGVIYMTGGSILADKAIGSYTFEHNKAANGSVIYAENATFTVDSNVAFTNNIATVGTIYFNNIKGFATGNSSLTFNNNRAEKGLCYAFANNNTAVTISSLSVAGVSGTSSALYFDGGTETITIKNSKYENNGSATSVGSVMYINNAKVTLDKDIVFNNNYNAVFNNGGTFTTVTLTGPHATTIDEHSTNDIVFVNGLGDYVLSGNSGATFNLGGGIFKNTANNSTYAYKLSTPSGIAGGGKVNFLFNGNITFATGSNIRNIYVTNASTETFKIGTATRDMMLAYYVPERGTKIIDNIYSAGGFTPTFTYNDVTYVEDPYRDRETPAKPWTAYVQKVNGIDNVYVGYKTYEVTIYANGGAFKGMTGDTHRIVPAGVVNPTTYSILIPDGYKILYLTTPSRIGYKTTQFSTKPRATDSGAIVITNDTTYDHSTHGEKIYANWSPITYTIKFDPATTSASGRMDDIPNVPFDREIVLPTVDYRVPTSTFSNWIDKDGIDYSKEDPETAPRIEISYKNMAKVKNLRCVDGDIVVLYANWEAGPFEIVFDKNTPVSPGGYENIVKGDTATQSRSGKEKKALSPNGYSVDGYRFIGWSEKPLTASESEAIENIPSMYYKNMQEVVIDPKGSTLVTLYAMWGRNKYYLSLAQNERFGEIADPYVGRFEILYDQKYSELSAFAPKTRTNYTFTGKFVTSRIEQPYDRKHYNGTNYYTVDSVYRDTGDKVLWPLWTNNEVEITMVVGEGSLPAGKTSNKFIGYLDAPYYSKGTTSEPKNEDGSLVKAISATVSKIFRKWSTLPDGSDEINSSTLFTDPSKNEIYAVYIDKYKVYIYYEPGYRGRGTMDPSSGDVGSTLTVKRNLFDRSGHTFSYWQGSDGNKYYPGNGVLLYDNLTLTAQWTKGGGSSGGNTGGGTGGGGGGGAGGTIPVSQQVTVNANWEIDPVSGKYIARDANGNIISGWQYSVNVNDNNNSWHYFNSDGTAKTGWVRYDSSVYYFDNYGNMVTGLAYIDGTARQFDENGQLISDDTGIDADIIVDLNSSNSGERGNWNYDPITNNWQYMIDGQPAKNTWFESNVTGTSCWYAVDSNGNMLTGLVRTNGSIYYLQESGAEAGKLMANATVTINGVVFETDAEGKIIGDLSLFGNIFNIYDMDQMAGENQNGETIPIIEPPVVNFANTQFTQGFVNAGNGIIYFMVPVTDAAGNITYEKATGVVQIDGFYYYFGNDGVMRTGLVEINGKLYYLSEVGDRIGSVYVGYITLGGVTYYCDPANGGAATRIN